MGAQLRARGIELDLSTRTSPAHVGETSAEVSCGGDIHKLSKLLHVGTPAEIEAAIPDTLSANACTSWGETLLMKAIKLITSEHGAQKAWLMKLLLEKGAN